MIDIMNNKITSNVTMDITRNIIDDRIRQNPLHACHIVTDSITERIVNEDNWQFKQLGLSPKMYINK